MLEKIAPDGVFSYEIRSAPMEKQDTWLKKHVDTLTIIGFVLGAAMWMNFKINQVEKDITIIKTVLIMKNIMPTELAKADSAKR
jgi:hypothetical protein